MKNYVPIINILFAILVASNLLNAKADEEKKLPMITNTPSNPEIIGTYFKTMYHVASGNKDDAQKNFNTLLKKSAPIAANRGRIHFLSETGQYEAILVDIETWDKHFADDASVQRNVVEALVHTKQNKKALDRLIKLFNKFPDDQKIAMYLVQAYLDMHDEVNTLYVIETHLANASAKPNNFMFLFLKAQILLNQNKKDKALEALKQCLATYRNFDKAWFLYAVVEEQMGNLEQAIKGYTTFLDIVGRNPDVQNRLLELLFKQKRANGLNPINSNPCLQKAILLFEHNQPLEALKQIEECLKKENNNTEARLLKIQIHESLGAVQQAFKLLTEWMEAQPENEMWFKLAALLHKKGLKRRDLIQAFQHVEQKNPKAVLPVQYLADLYLRANNQQQALLYLQKFIELTNNSLSKAKAHYQRARIYHQQHNSQAMVKELEAGYAVNSTFAPLCNMLSYHYAGKGNNRVKALELVRQALKVEPENPHYLDTLGYISYKQGDLTNALKIIEPLASRVPDDTVIENHMRKIHHSLTQHALTQGGKSEAHKG